MEDYCSVVNQIQNSLGQGKATEALDLTITLLENNSDNLSVDLMCAALFIDCGTELGKIDVVEEGIKIIEFCLVNVEGLSADSLVNLHYNISNGYATKSQLHQQNNHFDLMQESMHKQKYYLQLALLKKEHINSDLLPNVITNYANLLDQLGRTVEAVDYYYDCLSIAPDHAVAMGNCSCALKRLFNISKERNPKLLYESWRLLRKAIQLKDKVIERSGYKALSGYEKELNELEIYISNLYPNGVDDLEQSIINFNEIHTSWNPSLIKKRIKLDKLLLSVNTFFSDCPSEYRDEIFFESMIVPLEDNNLWFQNLSHTFNNIKEDFATARYFYYQSQSENTDLIEVSSMTSYMDTFDYADFGIRSGLLKSSLRLSADLMDKCAVFLNLYLELGNQEDHVSFSNFWYEKLKYKKNQDNKGMHPKVQRLLKTNRFFAALYDVQRDLFEGRYPFPYKSLRNEATHKRLVLSWYGSLDEEIKSYSLSEFKEITHSLLRMAKASIIYLVGVVMLEEIEKELEHKKNGTHSLIVQEGFPFEIGIGLSDHLSSS